MLHVKKKTSHAKEQQELYFSHFMSCVSESLLAKLHLDKQNVIMEEEEERTRKADLKDAKIKTTEAKHHSGIYLVFF